MIPCVACNESVAVELSEVEVQVLAFILGKLWCSIKIRVVEGLSLDANMWSPPDTVLGLVIGHFRPF